MKKKIAIICSAIAAVIVGIIILICVLSSGDDAYRNIKIFKLEGEATVTRNEKVLEARNEMSLRSNDDILVADDSHLIIKLDEDKFIYLKENSHIGLVSSEKDSSLTRIIVYEGTIITEVKEKLNGDIFDVEAPNSVMSIRGTIVSTTVEKNNNETTVSHNLVEGIVGVTIVQIDDDIYQVDEFSLAAGAGVNIKIDNNSFVAANEINEVVSNNECNSYDSLEEYQTVNGEVLVSEEKLEPEQIDEILAESIEFSYEEKLISVVALSCQFSVNDSNDLLYSYEANEAYSIKVYPNEKDGYSFKHLLINDEVYTGDKLELNISEKTVIKAVYEVVEEDLELNISKYNIGNVDSTDAIIKADGAEINNENITVEMNQKINLSATEAANAVFLGWAHLDGDVLEYVSHDKDYSYTFDGNYMNINAVYGYKETEVVINFKTGLASLDITLPSSEVVTVTETSTNIIKYNETIKFDMVVPEGATFKGFENAFNNEVISTENIIEITADGLSNRIEINALIDLKYDYLELDGTNTVFTEYLNGTYYIGSNNFDYSNLIIKGYSSLFDLEEEIALEDVEIIIENNDGVVSEIDLTVPGLYYYEFRYYTTEEEYVSGYATITIAVEEPQYFIEFGLNTANEDLTSGFRVVNEIGDGADRCTVPMRNGLALGQEGYFKEVGFDHNRDFGEYGEGIDRSLIKYNCYSDLITMNADETYSLNMSVTVPDGYSLYVGTYFEDEEMYYTKYSKVEASDSITDYLDWNLSETDFYGYTCIRFIVAYNEIPEEEVSEDLVYDRINYLNQIYGITVGIDKSEYEVSLTYGGRYFADDELSETADMGATGNYVDGVVNLGCVTSKEYGNRILNYSLNDDGSLSFEIENYLNKTIRYIDVDGNEIETNEEFVELCLMASEGYTEENLYRIFYYFELDGINYCYYADLAYPGICSDSGYNYCDDDVISGENPYCYYHGYTERTEVIFEYYFGENGLFVKQQ